MFLCCLEKESPASSLIIIFLLFTKSRGLGLGFRLIHLRGEQSKPLCNHLL